MSKASSPSDEQVFQLIRRVRPPDSEETLDQRRIEGERLVKRILALEPIPSTSTGRPRLPSAGRAHRRVTALVGSTAVVVAAAITAALVLSAGSQPSTAWAGWTASPTTPTARQLHVAEAACAKHHTGLASLTLSVAEQRGPYTMLVYTYGRWPTSCIVGKPSPGQPTVSLGTVDGTSHLTRLAKTPYRDLIVIRQLSGLGAHFHVPGSHERGDLPGAGFLDGQTVADVTGVTFELQDHRDVKASLEHGWFAAWWPGSQGLRAVKVTTTTGTTAEPLSGWLTHAPAPNFADSEPPYPRNAAGETYGSAANAEAGEEPDLISASQLNAHHERVHGYIRKSELNAADSCRNVDSPEEALACQKRRAHEPPKTIPMFARNGRTIVGRFRIG